MSQPFIGEIRMFGGNFAPAGWAFCEGQLMPISENDALFTLIGTTYGGDGQETFGLPNLQSRVPIHMGKGPDGTTYNIGEMAGTETVTLTTQQIPQHTHALIGSSATATTQDPTDNVLAASQASIYYNLADNIGKMVASAIQPDGGSQPHENCQPFLCINFIISLFGIFPQQN
jgi:microcystin-dependent protein